MKYVKYHALGNDYIVLSPADFEKLNKEMIYIICHRNYGVGSDGILVGPFESKMCDFALKIFNPDGSEAEMSGNGLRIFARFLYDNLFIKKSVFTLETLGGPVLCEIKKHSKVVKLNMGRVSFNSKKIPVKGKTREVINEIIDIDGKKITFSAVTIGNPHCVVLSENVSPEIAYKYGPILEKHALFPNRINVQFMRVLDRANIQIEIWERGAGYTLASGTSSTAAAAVAHKLNLCDSEITVHMHGGQIKVRFDRNFAVTLTGTVTKVCEGIMAEEMFLKLHSP